MALQQGQTLELPLRPCSRQPQPQPQLDHSHHRSAAIITTVHDPHLEHLVTDGYIDDDWLIVSAPRGPGTEANNSTSNATSNATITTTSTNNDNLNHNTRSHNGKQRLTTSNLVLLDMINHAAAAKHHRSRRSNSKGKGKGKGKVRTHCTSLMALGAPSTSSSVESVDKVLPQDPWSPANVCFRDAELFGIGGWMNQ